MEELFNDLKSNISKCSFLVKYRDFRIDEESQQVIMIQEHWTEMIDFDYHIKNYGYIEESKIKIIAFQIIKGIKALASIKRNHG